MSRIFVAGLGAVSPAGWNVAALREALERNEPLPVQPLTRPGWEKPILARLAPNPPARPEFLSHPRLRRASPITHYTASAALEAAAQWRNRGVAENARLGVVVCLHAGCVQYTARFYEEVLQNPATASPLIFPETVYAAPASHVAALLGNVALAASLVGDPSAFLQGVVLATQWLAENQVDAGLVIGAEETHWLTADALRLFDRRAVFSAGAGALCLCREPEWSLGVELVAITDAHTYTAQINRTQASAAMRGQLNSFSPDELLCDGLGNGPRMDAAEQAAWRAWRGPRVSPKHILGEGLMAAAAWQCVAACDAVAGKKFAAANVSLVGLNQQAIGARFERRNER